MTSGEVGQVPANACLEVDIEQAAGTDLVEEFNRVASYLGAVDDGRRV